MLLLRQQQTKELIFRHKTSRGRQRGASVRVGRPHTRRVGNHRPDQGRGERSRLFSPHHRKENNNHTSHGLSVIHFGGICCLLLFLLLIHHSSQTLTGKVFKDDVIITEEEEVEVRQADGWTDARIETCEWVRETERQKDGWVDDGETDTDR